MIFALLPVKSPAHAKQRLSPLLTPDQRERLARLMYEEMLATLCSSRNLDRVVVVTSHPAAAHPGGLMFDIDTPEDVAELLARAPGNRVTRFLCPSGF